MTLLRQMRIHHACRMLLTAPERTIESVARASGFTGSRDFYRAFRRQTGLTPAEYREHAVTRRARPVFSRREADSAPPHDPEATRFRRCPGQ